MLFKTIFFLNLIVSGVFFMYEEKTTTKKSNTSQVYIYIQISVMPE